MTDHAKYGGGLPVPAAKQYCTNCLKLGHSCVAQDGCDLCVFCEDGEVCPVAAAAARNGAQANAKNRVSAEPDPDREGAARGRSSEALRSPEQKKPGEYERRFGDNVGEKKCACGCGTLISPVRTYARGHRSKAPIAADVTGYVGWQNEQKAYREKRKAARAVKENAMPTGKKLKCPVCDKELVANSFYGHLPKQHGWDAKKVSEWIASQSPWSSGSTASGSKAKPKSAAAADSLLRRGQPKANGHARIADAAVATICVTEGALDRNQVLDGLVLDLLSGKRGGWPLSPREKTLVAILGRCRGQMMSRSNESLAKTLNCSAREVKAMVKSLVEDFGLPVGASRGEPSGYYLIMTAEEARHTAAAYVNEIRSLARRVKAIEPDHKILELLGQMKFEDEAGA